MPGFIEEIPRKAEVVQPVTFFTVFQTLLKKAKIGEFGR